MVNTAQPEAPGGRRRVAANRLVFADRELIGKIDQEKDARGDSSRTQTLAKILAEYFSAKNVRA